MAALVNEEFVVAGEIMASSIAQGGPAPNVMNAFSFSYIANGVQSVKTNCTIVEDVVLKLLLTKLVITLIYDKNVLNFTPVVPFHCMVSDNYLIIV